VKAISLKLPDGLHAKLERLARIRRETKSEIVRDALEQMFNGTRRSKPISALELAGDLVGSCEGPGDLSTNPKYMEGFGK
jgi:metal-responsive CopG/Arc/MetJ family transcriptional regulator